jgi:hypothetical protein
VLLLWQLITEEMLLLLLLLLLLLQHQSCRCTQQAVRRRPAERTRS